MFATHQHHAVLASRTLLMVAAVLLGLVSSNLFGADNIGDKTAPPGLLPIGTDEAAVPMNHVGDSSFSDDARTAIEQQHTGHWNEAVATWRRATPAPESELWWHLSIGVGQLKLGNLDLAAEQFTRAGQCDPKNPAVHYFVGLLRIKQSAIACASDDTVPQTAMRFVDDVPDEPASSIDDCNATSRLTLQAIKELQAAVTYASRLDLNSPLADVRWVVPVPYPITVPRAAPTIGELLGSLGADNLAGKAHGLLANLYLDQGRPDQAEYHADEASSLGIAVPFAYQSAGKLFESRGQDADAFRLYLKAMRQGEGIVAPETKAFEKLGGALEEL